MLIDAPSRRSRSMDFSFFLKSPRNSFSVLAMVQFLSRWILIMLIMEIICWWLRYYALFDSWIRCSLSSISAVSSHIPFLLWEIMISGLLRDQRCISTLNLVLVYVLYFRIRMDFHMFHNATLQSHCCFSRNDPDRRISHIEKIIFILHRFFIKADSFSDFIL